MRKTLLSLASVMVVGTAMAAVPSLRSTSENPFLKKGLNRHPSAKFIENKQKSAMPMGATRAELSMNWGWCEGAWMAIPTNTGEVKFAVQIPVELAAKYAGATISSVSVCSPVDVTTGVFDEETYEMNYENPVKDVKVWLSESLDGEPISSAEGELSESGFAWNEIQLDEEYTIKADKAIYVGYTLNLPDDENIFALITDYGYPDNSYSCYTYTTLKGYDEDYNPVFGGDYKWREQGDDYGNLSLRCRISGENLPVNDLAIVDYLVPNFAAPGEEFTTGIMVRNQGANLIENITLTFEIEGMEPQVKDIDLSYGPLDYNESSVDYIEYVCDVEGNNIAYKWYISKINGEAVDLADSAVEGVLLCITEGFPKMQLVEEATGTWCGWCVFGYAGMEYMAKNYGDESFIGVAVHSEDPMDVMGEGQAYQFFENKVSGFPSSYFNRDMSNNVYPSPDNLEEYYFYLLEQPAFAKISATLEATDDPKVLKLSTQSQFILGEEDCAYKVGYTVIEDNVGPYPQTNYCSGEEEDCYGFEDLPEKVKLVFNDVARNCSAPEGLDGSIPSTTDADEVYSYATEIKLDGVKDLSKVRVVAYVVNAFNGSIENSCEVKSPEYAGVNTISTSKELATVLGANGMIIFRGGVKNANVYTLDGRCIAKGLSASSIKVPAGVYLVTNNGKTSKVLVK